MATPTGQTGLHPNDKNHMGSDAQILARIAQMRKSRGLDPDPASDRIWLNRIKAGGVAVFGQARTAIENKAVTLSKQAASAPAPKAPQQQQNPNPKPAAPLGNTPGNTSTVPDFATTAPHLYPYLPKPILDLFIEEYAKNGGSIDLAVQAVRQSSIYETHYPGNKREDGTVRYNEQDYARQVDGYRKVLAYYDIPPETFKHKFGDLIGFEVDAAEFQQRIDQTFVAVMSRGDAIRETYSRYYGAVSDAAILANAIDPTKSIPELMLEFSRAEIGGAAQESGFGIDLGEATRLQAAGLDLEAARNFYRRAQGLLPTLGELVSRNNDPDDEFSLEELTNALIFSDPTQMKRIQRNITGEASRYTGQGQVAQEEGRFTGLRQR